jgi:REP element-mobilizing transposase RayT
MAVTRLVTIISITAKQVFKKKTELRKELWEASLWTSDYCALTVGKHENEKVTGEYIKEQGCEAEYVRVQKDQLRVQ